MTENPTPRPDRFAERTDEDATTAFRAQDGTGPRSDGVVPYYEAPPYPGQQQQVATPRAVTPPLVSEPADDEGHVVPVSRGTTDLGLLLLRVGLGAVIGGHGLQKVFGLFNGPGLDGFRGLLEGSGYRYPQILSYVGSLTELIAGALLILGFVTPLAAAAALGTTINAWFVADLADPGFAFFVGNGGQEHEMLLVVLAGAVAFAGPGRYSLDARRGWAARPRASSWLSAVVGIAAGLVVWFVLNGTTPFA